MPKAFGNTSSIPLKAVPVGADLVMVADSADGFKARMATVTSVQTAVTGDVHGPSSSVSGNFASFSDATGKILADSGAKAADFTPKSRTLTINETSYDLSADRSWTITAGGLTRDVWYALSGSYASASTFTTTEASSAEATRLAGLAERSLFTCTDTTGATRRIGYVKSASAVGSSVTYTVITNSDLASGDKDFHITPNRKVEDYRHLISVPGELVVDASNPQGVWLQNLKTASYLLPVNSSVRTAAVGAGAAAAWNVYAGASNLFSAAQDMTTSATFDEKRPTTNTIAAGDTVSARITSSGGATNKAQDIQLELFIVPQTLYTSQA